VAVTDAEVHGTVQGYLRRFPGEADRIRPLLEAMREPRPTGLYSRALTDPGHVTASVLLLDPDGRHVLYLMDDKRERWLLPGGHVSVDDLSLSDTARRELAEETGIPAAQVTAWPGHTSLPLDIGLRRASGSKKRGEPPHLHFDLRYPMTTDADVSHLLADHAACYRWMPLAAAPPVRIAAKLAAL